MPLPDRTLPRAALPALPAGPACAWRPAARGPAAEAEARAWLAGLLGRAPDPGELVRDARGRPRLRGRLAGHDVGWSHSGEGLLLAFGRAMVVGVDLERLRPRPRALELARRFFTAGEAAWLATREPDRRAHAFLRLWCAKEAVLKAHGEGLAFGLHRLRFAVDGAGALKMADCDPALGTPGDWHLHEWTPLEGYLAALAWRPRAPRRG